MHLSLFTVRALAVVALMALIGTSLRAHAAGANAAGALSAAFPAPGIDVANIDSTCKACDDFYAFATGGWQKTHPIPAGYSAWGSINILVEDNRNVLHELLEKASKNNAAPGSNEQKIGTFFRTCMDEDAIEAAGLAPIQSELDRVSAIGDRASLMAELAHLQRIGVAAPLPLDSDSDAKDSSKEIAELGMGGLGLPDRDFYFRNDDKSKSVRAAYVSYIATILGMSGDAAPAAATEATAVMAIESAIATVTPKLADLRDPLKLYHPMAIAEITTLAPDVNWPQYFAAYEAPAFNTLNVVVPDYVKGVDAQLGAAPIAIWRAYFRYHLIDTYATALPKRFADASFGFHMTTLDGVKEQLPRWKRCTAAADRSLGEALGAVYVAQVFSPAAKARALALVNNLQNVLHDDIESLAWMSSPTKTRAETKLAAFTKKIGYPDRLRDYSALTIVDGPYMANVEGVRIFEANRELLKIGTVTDRTEWEMSPPTVDAYYEPSNNEIVFPAGILKPPFFSEAADDAVNYGAVGAVIGHEMTHGFDDEGRRYDEHGDLNDWWTPRDAASFSQRAQCIVDEYSGFSPAPGVNIQGKLVQGEAIADLGGITIAYKAFERTREFKSGAAIDGYTPQQRFFLAYANILARNEREESARNQALTNQHPDPKYRVIGTLSNMPEFRAAFRCVVGDKMVRAHSCQIW